MGQGNGELRRGAFPGTAGILPALLILGTAHESCGTRQAGRLRSQGRQKEASRLLSALPLSRLVRAGRMPAAPMTAHACPAPAQCGNPVCNPPASSKWHSHPGCHSHRSQAGCLCHLPTSTPNGRSPTTKHHYLQTSQRGLNLAPFGAVRGRGLSNHKGITMAGRNLRLVRSVNGMEEPGCAPDGLARN